MNRPRGTRGDLTPPLHRSGFTLIELLIVIAIISGLAAIVFVSVNPKVRLDSARDAQESTNARQLTQAIQLHLADKALNAESGPDPCPINVPDRSTVNICKSGNVGCDPDDPDDPNDPYDPDCTPDKQCIDLQCVVSKGYIHDIPMTREAANGITPNSGYALHREGPFFTVETIALNLSFGSSSSSSSSSSAAGYPPIDLNALTAEQILQLLIDRNFVALPGTPNPTVADLLARVDFERFFSTLSVDETMSLLLRRNYINGPTTIAALKAQLAARQHMDVNALRPDGVLSALWLTENSSGVPFLKQSATTVRNAFKNDFDDGNQLAVIDAISSPSISPARLIGLFYDAILNTSTVAKRPEIFAWVTSLWPGDYNVHLYNPNPALSNFYGMYTPWIGDDSTGATPLIHFYSATSPLSDFNLNSVKSEIENQLPPGHVAWKNGNLTVMCWETIDPIPGQPKKYSRTDRYKPETPTPDYSRCSNVKSYTPGNSPSLLFLGPNAPLSPPYNSRIDSNGDPREFKTLWWDEWVTSMNTRINYIFGAYKVLGGKLDNFDFDLEVADMSSYYFFSTEYNTSQFGADKFFPEMSPTGKRPCDLVYEDPRWNTIPDTADQNETRTLRQILLDAGALPSDVDYSSVDGMGRHTGGLCNMSGDSNDNRLRGRFGRIWNAVMEHRTDTYAERAVIDPLQALYPSITTQGYKVHYRNQTLTTTTNDAFHMPTSFYGMGSQFGTHQSTVHYQGLDNIPVDKNGTGNPEFVPAIPKSYTWISSMQILNGVATIGIGLPSESLPTDQYGLKTGDVFGITTSRCKVGDTTIINSTNTGEYDVKPYLGYFLVIGRPDAKTITATPYANTDPAASGNLPPVYPYDYRSASCNLYINTWHPFNALLDDAIGLRSAYATSTVPNRPYFTEPSWAIMNNDIITGLTDGNGKNIGIPYPTFGDTALDVSRAIHPYPVYSPEIIFHAGLMGVERFMSWNPYQNEYGREFPPYWGNSGTPAERVFKNNKLMSDAVKEVESVVGFVEKKPVVYPPLTYSDKFVITGMEAGGKRVFRVTPDPRETVSLDPANVQSSSLTATSQTAVRITIGSQILQIANAYIYTPATTTAKCPYAAPLEHCGFWIIQTEPPLYLTEPPADIITKLTNGEP